MEAAGLILGVLPLVVSTIEHYDFFAPFICHCAFMRELQNFRRKLDARKLLFRNECRLLLEVLVQEELIEEMFREGSTHPSWTDMDLNERVRLYLGESHEACVDMMAAIEDCIDQLRQKTQGLSAVLSPKADCESIGDKQWRQRVGSYIKVAFRKKGLDNDLEALKDLNGDLRELTRQIRELKEGQQRRAQLSTNRQAIARRSDLSGFQTVRKTSENLYRALDRVSSCLAHKEHSATLCIDAMPLQESKISRVRFNMAFGANNSGGPVWINIESTVTGNTAEGTVQVVQSLPEGRTMVAGLKRQLESSVVDTATLAKLSKTTESLESCSRETCTTSLEQKSQKISRSPENVMGTGLQHTDEFGIPDLSIRNFCFHIQQNTHHGTHERDVCAGFLRDGLCDHLLYLPPRSSHPKQESQSLAHIISSISDDWPLSSYSRIERIRLAKLLAKAVLEYHDTPWLQESWRSQDVQFFVEHSRPLAALDTPHLTVRFPSFSKTPPRQSQSFVENNTLFGLAIIFLELDFEKLLSHMRLPGDVVENSPRDTEFRTAARLAKSTSPGLGPDFRKIVRKCLRCNFGIDETDLTKSEELKSKIHEEVICGLEDLERTLASCTLVDSRG